MKKNYFIITLFIATSNLIFGTKLPEPCHTCIQMPSKEILQEMFRNKKDFGYFDEKTDFIAKLANEEKTPLALVLYVELALYDFKKSMEDDPEDDLIILMSQPNDKRVLIETLLKNHPDTLDCLKTFGKI